MKYLIKKELVFFFSSAIGYVIIFVWLFTLSLLLWFFSGEYNLLDGGYATLRPFFSLAPMLFILIIPSVTMRSFAEERRMGTLELLFSRPLSVTSVMLSKFRASFLLMVILLLPTSCYVISVYYLSASGLDIGEVIGGYCGLLLLQSAFLSIGIFTSSLTSNQLTAFLSGAFLCFAFYYGFELIASLFTSGSLSNFWAGMGLKAHYHSMIRGVLDSRDIICFISVTVLFLCLTVSINNRKR